MKTKRVKQPPFALPYAISQVDNRRLDRLVARALRDGLIVDAQTDAFKRCQIQKAFKRGLRELENEAGLGHGVRMVARGIVPNAEAPVTTKHTTRI